MDTIQNAIDFLLDLQAEWDWKNGNSKSKDIRSLKVSGNPFSLPFLPQMKILKYPLCLARQINGASVRVS